MSDIITGTLSVSNDVIADIAGYAALSCYGVVGMDEQITSRIQEQVNSVSSLVEQPGLTQKEYDAQERERQAERLMHGSEIFNGGATEKTPEEVERLMQESYS